MVTETGQGCMDLSAPRAILATCPKGIGPVLAAEMAELGYVVDQELPYGVTTRGTLEDAVRMNLFLRTAHRVHLLLASFSAPGPDELYGRVAAMPWEELIAPEGHVSFHSHVYGDMVRDSRFANVRAKDGLADRMRRATGKRPDSGPDKSGTVIYVHWTSQECQIWLDTSGEPLNRRGYRTMPHKAPLQETLAAALVLSSRFTPDMDFINPMCGSGTLAIEAALLAMKQAPALDRTNFGFMHVLPFRRPMLAAARDEAEELRTTRPRGRFILTDHDPDALKAARNNARRAGVEQWFSFDRCDFADTPIPDGDDAQGVVMLNPEYGMRLGDEDSLAGTYKRIGDFFKQQCRGMTGYIFTGNPRLAKQVGLKPSRRMIFHNSNIECRLLEYEIYAGSRKAKYEQDA